ncbi:MAG TPA: hydroxyacylglutathione hydrolase [Burkholderiaceae bacterium]
MQTPVDVLAVPAFKDNYLWLLVQGTQAVVVDPGDAAPIQQVLQEKNLSLSAILLTHHHADHVGGVPALAKAWQAPVYGPDNPTITGITHVLREGDSVEVLGIRFAVLAVPGHTLDHIAYHDAAGQRLFCGDTLFAGGCGRLFEGTPRQMAASLAKLAALPGDTAVYCAHEYTLENLRFARAAEPNNAALTARSADEQRKRDAGIPTVPSTIARELATNPFLRTGEPALAARLLADGKLEETQAVDRVAIFAALRQWKNEFK